MTIHKQKNTTIGLIVCCFVCCFSLSESFSQISNPLQIQGISAWWCADSVFQDEGSKVTVWQSQANSSLFVTQINENNAPTLVKNVSELNNHAVLHFDGDDYLNGGNILNVGSKGQTAFVVAKTNNKNGSFFAKSLLGSIANRNCLIYEGKTEYLVQIGTSNYVPVGPACVGDWSLFSTRIDLLNCYMSLFQNGWYFTKEIPGTSRTITSTFDFLIGAYNNANGTVPPYAGLYLNGDIAEIIFYNRPLSNVERQTVENYLRSKYFPGTEREQFSLGEDIVQEKSLKPVVLSVPDRSYFKTYEWNTGETSKSISVTQSGTYSVHVEDDWGYEYFDTISVEFSSVKQIQDQIICQGQSIVWDCGMEGDYTYSWSSGETSRAITISKAGTYSVVVTDKEGYSISSKPVTIVVDSFPVKASLGEDRALCEGNQLRLESDMAKAAKAYVWGNGTKNDFCTVDKPGEYSVMVTDTNGCVAYDTVNISVKGIAPVAEFVVEAVCEGDATQFVQNSSTKDNTALISHSWVIEQDTIAGGIISYQFPSWGDYPVQLLSESETGCVGIKYDTIAIHPKPKVDFLPKRVCQYTEREILPQTSIASGKIVSYEWKGIGKSSEESSFKFLSDTVASYPLSLRVLSDFGCEASVSADVETFPSTKLEVVHTKNCLGDTVIVFDISDYKPYNAKTEGFWMYDGVKYPYQTVVSLISRDLEAHPISLHVKTMNGCWNIKNDTLKAHDVPRPVLKDTVYGCVDEEIRLTKKDVGGDKISEIQWNIDGEISEENSPIVSFTDAGVHVCTLYEKTEFECESYAQSVVVIDTMPKANFTFFPEYGATPLDVQFTNTSEHAVTYEWLFEQSVQSDEFEPSYTFIDKDNSYAELWVKSEHGCVDSVIKHIPAQMSDMRLQIVDIQTTVKNGSVQYEIKILNSGNDNIPEIDVSIVSPDFIPLTETWFGNLKVGNVLTYKFNARTETKNSAVPTYICATAKIASSSQNATYYSDEYCKDNTGDFTFYQISPNPVTDYAKLYFSTNQYGTVTIECVDESGKVRLSQDFPDISEGFHSVVVDTSFLPVGRYVFLVKQGNKKKQIPLIKM